MVLTGPGAKSNTGDRKGSIAVSNANKSVGIERTGFGTKIKGDGEAPDLPSLIPLAVIQELTDSLEPALNPQNAQEDA